MKSIRTLGVIAVALLAVASPTFAQVKDYREIKTPALRAFSMPQPKRIQLANGMVIFLQEDHELPLIRGSATIRGGERDVPAEKAGLVTVYSQAWRTGGTKAKTGEQLDEFLAARAARLETNGDEDSTNVNFDVLKGDLDSVMPLWLDLIRNPEFRQEKIDLARTQENTGISRRNDDPGQILAREADKLGYGADSPYARVPEYSTVAAVTRDDLMHFHDRFVHPNNMIIGVIGDFDPKVMESKLRTAFEAWAKGPHTPRTPDAGHAAKPGIYFVSKDDVTQANIAVIQPAGLLRSDPDYFPAIVMNEILSGGFSGRLMNKLRSEMGLTYGVGGGITAPWDHPGLFRVRMATKTTSTVQSIDALRAEVAALQTKPFTTEELQSAKDALLNAYVFTADSRQKVLGQRVQLEFYGYPADFYQRYPDNVQKVTADDVARVAKKYVHPEQQALLVVGKEKDFDKPLSSLGTVAKVDITIPEPGAKPSAPGAAAAAPAAPPVSNAEGLALINKLLAFVGGKAKVDAVSSVHSTGAMSLKTPQGMMDAEIDSIIRYPDTQRRVMKLPMGEIVMVVTPDAAFMTSPMGSQDMPGSQREAMARDLRQDMLAILKNIGKPDYTFTSMGTEKVGTADAAVVQVGTGGSTVKLYLDPATGQMLRKSNAGRTGQQDTDYSDWKNFNGLNIPMSATITVNGEPSGGASMKTVEVNSAIDPKVFEKPAAK
ncbi:MAG: pitrilysin family protein [Acidobacteriota bacterium]